MTGPETATDTDRPRIRGRRSTAFTKVEGAGNDFVLVDRREGTRRLPQPREINDLLDRHRGVGGDGLLLLGEPKDDLDTTVAYFNSDGAPAEFCGNGARCVARYLFQTHPESESLRFRLGEVIVRARRKEETRIEILHPTPRFLSLPDESPDIPAGMDVSWIDSGVPHWILPVASQDQIDLEEWGPKIRNDRSLAPKGTNVDLVELGINEVFVRTWERGVEGETEACGSGLLAAGFWAAQRRGWSFPLRLRSKGGDTFQLRTDESDEGLWLEGPANIVFRGEFDF